MNSARNKRYWGTQRVAKACQVTPATVAHWIDQGLLKGHKTPTGRRRVASGDLVEFFRRHDMTLPPELVELMQERERDIVVVVEDDPSYLRALRRYIETQAPEIELVTAGNGVDGLMAIGRTEPDLIVLDYRLPDFNAVQLLERLTTPGNELVAEVVVVTGGLPDAAVEERLLRAGAKQIVNKSEGLPAVVQAIRETLQQRKAA